jgi:hypothetical protein
VGCRRRRVSWAAAPAANPVRRRIPRKWTAGQTLDRGCVAGETSMTALLGRYGVNQKGSVITRVVARS